MMTTRSLLLFTSGAFAVLTAGACGHPARSPAQAKQPRNATTLACAARADLPSAGPGDARQLYPAPRFIDVGALEAAAQSVCFDTSALDSHGRLDALLGGLAVEAGLALAPYDCTCDYRVTFTPQAPPLADDAAQIWSQAQGHPDRYVVSTSSSSDGRADARVFAADERGALYGVRAALSLVQWPATRDTQRVAAATIVDFPTFDRRGVNEGIYNRAFDPTQSCPSMFALPWRVGERRAAIALMSQLHMNTYLYGPKCDPYSREHWDLPYPSGSSDENVIRVMLHEVERQLIDFVWAVSPGMQGTAAIDIDKLKAKIESMRRIGVKHFAMFLDDIDDHSPLPQTQLINELDDYIASTAPGEHLLIVGTTYCGHAGNADNCQGPNAYTDTLGAQVNPGVEIMWTGEDVEPDTMSASDMTAVDQSLQRKVTIWDNWPVSSTSFAGRSADLANAVQGYFSNPVLSENGEPIRSYFGVLGPIADYLWAPERYDAAASFADWQPRLDASGVTACVPCGNNSDGWTCDANDAHRIAFCDPDTHCLSEHACPGGCVVGASGVEDVCN